MADSILADAGDLLARAASLLTRTKGIPERKATGVRPGDLALIGRASGGIGGGGFAGLTLAQATTEGLDVSEWVYVCVNQIAQPASLIPWRVSKFTSAKARKRFASELKTVPDHQRHEFVRAFDTKLLEPQDDHPLEKIIENPNPFFDRQALFERMTQHLLLAGNAVLWKNRGVTGTGAFDNRRGAPPLELWPLPPDEVKPVPDENSYLDHYDVRQPGGAKPKPIPVEDVVHAMLPNPSELFWGMGVIMGAKRAIELDQEAARWNKVSLENRAAPDSAFSIEEEIDEEEFEVMRAQVRAQYQGSDNARTPVLIGNGAKYYQMSLSPVEMDFLNSRMHNRDAIFAVFGVDKRVAGLGDSDDVTLRNHYVNTVMPYLVRLQSVFNRQLAPEFGPDFYLWFDATGVEALARDLHDKIRSAALLLRNGFSGQAVNRLFNLGFTAKEVELLEEGFLPASTRSVREVVEGEAQPSVEGVGETDPNSETPDGGEPLDDPGGDGVNVPAEDPIGREDTNKSNGTNGRREPSERERARKQIELWRREREREREREAKG